MLCRQSEIRPTAQHQNFNFTGGLVSRGIIILLTRFKGIQGHCTACTGYSESLLYKSCWVFGIRPTAHNKLDEMFVCGIAESMEERSSVGVDSPAIREMVSMLAQNVPTLPPQRKPTSWGGSPFSAPSQKQRKRTTAEADIETAENLLPFLSEMNPGISWLSAQPMG